MPSRPWIRRRFGLVSALSLLSAIAFAGKEFVKPMAQNAASYAAHDQHASDSVTVAVEPYDTADKAQIFTTNYRELDLLPVLLVVTNDSNQPLTLVQMQARLVTGGRSQLSPANSDELYRRLSHPTASTNPYPLPIPLPGKKVKGTVNSKQLREIEAAQFSAKAVEPHTTQSGFLFFDVAGISRPLAGSRFYLDGVRDSKGNDLIYFEVSLDQAGGAPKQP